MQEANRVARTVLRVNAALWALYKAGKISYQYLQTALSMSTSEKKKVVAKYKKPRSDAELKSLRQKVREIETTLKHDTSVRTYRQRDTYVEGVAENTKNSQLVAFTGSNLETSLANLRYWNESTGAYVTASPTSSTANAEIEVAKVYDRCIVRNNYQVPCDLEFYLCTPKEDTSISPSTAFTNGLTDQNNPSASSPLMFLTDSDQFNSLWKIKASVKKTLMPGQSASLVYNAKKRFFYDPSLFDSHAMIYQDSTAGHVFVIRVTGVLGHDTTVGSEQGFLPGAVDIARDLTVVCKYDSGGPALNDFVVLDNSSSFTNNGLVSARPMVDNQTYSIA